MKKILLFFCCIIILSSCLANVTKQKSVPSKSLYGYWSVEGVTWLQITSDSIYFVDEETSSPIKYSINKDTIIMYFDGTTQMSKYKVINDTLFMTNKEGTAKYIRVKE